MGLLGFLVNRTLTPPAKQPAWTLTHEDRTWVLKKQGSVVAHTSKRLSLPQAEKWAAKVSKQKFSVYPPVDTWDTHGRSEDEISARAFAQHDSLSAHVRRMDARARRLGL